MKSWPAMLGRNLEGKRDLSDLELLLSVCGCMNKYEGVRGKMVTVYQFLLVVTTVTGTIVSITSMYISGLKESLPRYAFFCCFGVLVSLVSIFMWFNQKKLEKTISNLKVVIENRNEAKQMEYFKKISLRVWMGLYWSHSSCIIFVFLYFIIPFGYDAFLVFTSNSTEPYALPMPNKGILGAEQPSRTFGYYSATIFIMVWTSCSCLVSSGFFSILFIFSIYICNELKAISEIVSIWGKKRYQVESDAISSLKQIITDHQNCLSLYHDMREILALPFFFFNVICPLSLTLFIYTAVMQNNVLLIMINIFCIFAISSFLFTCCFAGEILQAQSLLIFESIRDTNWYEMSPNIRKYLNMIIRQAVVPMTINYKGRAYLHLKTFTQMLNACYSYFMLLKSMN